MEENRVATLREHVPGGDILTDEASLERYSHDDAEWAPYERPVAVVLASGIDDVVATVRFAAEHGLSVVPRGSGTGLSGGANSTTTSPRSWWARKGHSA